MRPAFSEKELETKGYYDSPIPDKPGAPILNSPVTAKENILMALNGKKPYWYPLVGMIGGDYKPLRPRIMPENFIAHYVMDGEPPINWDGIPIDQLGWFDSMWRYEKVAGGPMIVPGSNKIDDICDWEKLTFPKLDNYDWEANAKANKAYMDCGLPVVYGIPTGFWERLMSILPVMNAAIALVDEDSNGAIHDFFGKLTDMYVDYLGRVKKYYNPDIVLLHDDWGHQNGPFFSIDTCYELIFPYFKRFVDTVHNLGMRFELHCCGKAQDFVPIMIEAGVDLWCPQPINDYEMLTTKYRDKGITFGLEVDPIAPGMPDEVAYEAAKKLVDTYKDAPIAYVNYGGSMKMYEYVYKLSRETLAD